MSEQDWDTGNRSAYQTIMSTCMQRLGYGYTVENKDALLIIEREQAIGALREVCKNHGDNDWDNQLNLSDIIQKHLANHLGHK